jgi:hypothetical protein
MFKILELKNTESALPAEVGYGYNTRPEAPQKCCCCNSKEE